MSDDFSHSRFPGPAPRGASVSSFGPAPFDEDFARWQAEYRQYLNTRRSRRRPPLVGLALVAILLLAVAFVLSPIFAFRSVRSAAQFGDVEALNRSVDFDAVRASLRVQLRPASAEAQAPANFLSDPLAALRRAWAPMSPQTDVNAYLTAESLASLTSGGGPDAPGSASDGTVGGPAPVFRYLDLDRARLGVRDPEAPQSETVFTFERKGLLRWILVGVRLPAGA